MRFTLADATNITGAMSRLVRQDSGMSEPVTAVVMQILIFGPGHSQDMSIEGFAPPDPEHFGVNAQVFIGSGDGYSDSFDVVVCSPSWLVESLSSPDWSRFNRGLRVIPETVLPGASIWLMRRWDRDEFETAVNAICDSYSPGPDWGTVACRIGRLIPWEFDYKYDAHVDEHYGEGFPPAR